MAQGIDNLTPDLRKQIRRFCLYGFLKNLQFFEPFLILVFIDKGLSFTQIGLLISFRAVCTNLMEIPSGAVADSWGLKKSMILSLLAYTVSFIVFAFAGAYASFFAAMFCFSLGEAFRTGTHKAIIFNWLANNNLKGEKTRVYGLTRSWSKQGSSLNGLAAAAILISFHSYQWVFLLSVIPYILNIINLALYPAEPRLENSENSTPAMQGLLKLRRGLKLVLRKPQLLSLITENICFEGIFSVVKDYLQPIVKSTALAIPIMLSAADRTRTALLMAAVYFVLNQGSSFASRFSHKAVARAGNERAMGRKLWLTASTVYASMLAGFHFEALWIPITAFVIMFVLLNIWKPVFVSRFHDHAEETTAATTLSVANQSKTLSIAVAAPVIGSIVDQAKSIAERPDSIRVYWPVAVTGTAAALIGLLLSCRKGSLTDNP